MDKILQIYLPMLVFLPLWTAALNLAGWREFTREFTGNLSTAVSIFCAGLGWLFFFRVDPPANIISANWINWEELQVQLEFLLDLESLFLLAIGTTILFIIHLFALQSSKRKANFKRLFIFLDLFSFIFLLLITAGNIYLFLSGLMGFTLCSFLFEGFNHPDIQEPWFGRLPFQFNFTGDLIFWLALIMLTSLTVQVSFISLKLSAGFVTYLIGLLLLFAVSLKSGQFPFQFWLSKIKFVSLPALTAICTLQLPVIVFMFYRFEFLLNSSYPISNIFQIWGAITALTGALLAATRKKYLEIVVFSVLSQVGWLLVSTGTGLLEIFHFSTVAAANLLLFGGAAAIKNRNPRELTIFESTTTVYPLSLSGLFILIGGLGITGLPLPGIAAVNWARPRIATSMLNSGWSGVILFSLLVVTTLSTGFYIFRLIINLLSLKTVTKKTSTDLPFMLLIYFLAAVAGLVLNIAAGYYIYHPGSYLILSENIIPRLIYSGALLAGMILAYFIFSTNYLSELIDSYYLAKSQDFLCKGIRRYKKIGQFLVKVLRGIRTLVEGIIENLFFNGLPALGAVIVEIIAELVSLFERPRKLGSVSEKIIIFIFILIMLIFWIAGSGKNLLIISAAPGFDF